MEARCVPFLSFVFVLLLQSALVAAGRHQTPNFTVTAPTQEIAEQVGEAAEFYRRELAIEWLGRELPSWYRPCPVTVKVGQIGAGGATTFTFEGGEVFGWRMNVQGSLERILDSVIPHEVSHTIFACHFRCPLPRWADEGAATLIENESERMRQTKLLDQVIHTNRRIPLPQLLAIKEYPRDPQQVLTLYAEGYSLASYLVQKGGEDGKAVYLEFLADAMETDWATAFRKHYDYKDLKEVEDDWTGWVLAGSQPLPFDEDTRLADNSRQQSTLQEPVANQPQTLEAAEASTPRPRDQVRGQSPRELAALPAINRELRSQAPRRRLSAPEPNVTALPEFIGSEWAPTDSTPSDGQAPVSPPARTRPADLGGHSTSGSSTAYAATRQAAGTGFPAQRTGDRATWPDERTDGLFSP